jgi:ATP-dependent Clp protease ATP-binding subunit ClpA
MNTGEIKVTNAPHLVSEWLSAHGFTDDAREVLERTRKHALQHPTPGEVSPMVVLLSLLRWERRLGLTVFEECGGNRRALTQDIISELCSAGEVAAEPVLNMRAVSDIAAVAVEEARTLGNNYVGTEHLFLALLKSDDDMLRRLLTKHGVSYESFKVTLLGIRGDSPRAG